MKHSTKRNTYTPLSTLSTEAVCLGVLWTLGAALAASLLIYFGTQSLQEIFQPIIEGLQAHQPKGL